MFRETEVPGSGEGEAEWHILRLWKIMLFKDDVGCKSTIYSLKGLKILPFV